MPATPNATLGAQKRLRVARAKKAITYRYPERSFSPEETQTRAQEFLAARLEVAIRETLDAAPTLTDSQRLELGHLLTSGGAK